MKATTQINTDNIRKVIDNLNSYNKYYFNKKSVFNISNYQDGDYEKLSSFNNLLKKIQNNYNDISNNINNLVSYMQEYCDDIEGLENKASENGGFVKESNASRILSKISMSIDSSSVNDMELFEINIYNEQNSSTQEMSKYMSKFLEDTDKKINNNEIVIDADEDIGSATKISKIGTVLKSLLGFIDSKVETPELIIDDKVYNETYKEYTEPLESQKILMKQYISAVDEELKEYDAIEKEFSRAKYHIRTIDDINMLSKESQNIIKEKFGTLDDYKKYIDELKSLKTSCEVNIEQIEQNIDVAKYECLTVLGDYEQYQNNDTVNSSEIAVINDNGVNYFTSYQEYCKKHGQVSELEYARAIEEKISNLSNEPYSVDNRTEQLLNLLHVSRKDETYSKIYNYLNDNYGREEANEYLKVIENTVNQAIGKEKAQAYLNTLSMDDNIEYAITNHLKVTGKGLDSGIQSSANGIGHAFSAVGAFFTGISPSRANTIDDYENMYLSQALATGDYTGAFLKDNYAISQGIGNMAPSLALGGAGGSIGATIGSVLLGTSSGGNSYHEMLTEGYTNSQALTYGVISGATEAITEKFLSGISFFNDVPVDSFKSYVHSMIKEGLEEGGQEIFDQGVKSLITGEKIDSNELKESVIQSALYGGLTAGILNTPSMIANRKYAKQQKTSQDLKVLEDNTTLKNNLSDISKDVVSKYEQLFIDVENEINFQARFSVSDIFGNALSIFQKLIYLDVKNNSQLSSDIVRNGLYHFTTEENAAKILQSGYVKKSDYITSYGKKKSFFFNGIPDIADVAINLSSIAQTQVAVKFDISESEVSDFRYRAYDDRAITHDGNYNFDNNNARLAYLALQFDENNKLVYREVSKQEFDMINETAHNLKSLNVFNEALKTLKACSIGASRQTEYFLKNINNLYTKAIDITSTGATIISSKINSIFDFTNPDFQMAVPAGMNVTVKIPEVTVKIPETNSVNQNLQNTTKLTKNLNLSKDNDNQGSLDVTRSLDLEEVTNAKQSASEIKPNKKSDGQNISSDLSLRKKLIENINNAKLANEKKIVNLKKKVLDSVNLNWNIYKKARQLYLKLNQSVNYDYNYIFGSKDFKDQIYTRQINFEILEAPNVICKSWSELYKELLLDVGIPEEKISIKSTGSEVGCHRWVEIDMGDNIIIADAADNIHGTTDLGNCKVGMSTVGFLVCDKSYSGKRLSKMEKNIIDYSEFQWKNIDKELDYINGDYHNTLIDKSKKLFANSKLYQEVFGNDCQQQDVKKVDMLFNVDLDNDMTGLEKYSYLKRLIKNLNFSSEAYTDVKIHYETIKIDDHFIFLTTVCATSDYDNYKYMVVGDGIEKQIFDSYSDYEKYRIKIEKEGEIINVR